MTKLERPASLEERMNSMLVALLNLSIPYDLTNAMPSSDFKNASFEGYLL